MFSLKHNSTSFKKGRKKTGGRKAGTPNKMPGFFIDALLVAGEVAGNEAGRPGLVGYLTQVARNDPKSFLRLLSLVLLKEK